MLNGLALRNGFEGAPKVRKIRFKCRATIDYECPNRSITDAMYVIRHHPSIARHSTSNSKVLLLRMANLSNTQVLPRADKLKLVKA
jgi:hypothetical protein